MKNCLKLVLLLFSSINAWQLDAQEAFAQSAIVLTAADDSRIIFEVNLDKNYRKTKINRDYRYYYQGALHESSSDFIGYLLNGKFSKTTKAGLLLQKGQYKCGLKDGVWKTWSNGQLVLMEKWKSGKLVKELDPSGTSKIAFGQKIKSLKVPKKDKDKKKNEKVKESTDKKKVKTKKKSNQ